MVKVNLDPQPGEGTIWFNYFMVYDPSGHGGMAPSRQLSKGVIAGVVLGDLGFVLIIMGCVVCYIRRRRSKKKEEEKHYHQDAVGYNFSDEGVNGTDIRWNGENGEGNWGEQDRQSSTWVSEGGQWYSKNGAQPFVLGLSASPYAGELPQSSHVVYRSSAAVASPNNSSHPASVVSIPTNIGRSCVTAPTAMDPRENLIPLRPPLTAGPTEHENSHLHGSSAGQDGGGANIGVLGSSTEWQNLVLRGAINEGGRENTGGGPGTHQAPITEKVRLSWHGDSYGQSGGPTVGTMITNPVDLGGSNNMAERLSERKTLQHVDSGPRLLEGPRSPVELPPLYSQIEIDGATLDSRGLKCFGSVRISAFNTGEFIIPLLAPDYDDIRTDSHDRFAKVPGNERGEPWKAARVIVGAVRDGGSRGLGLV
ncbi:hypothetical protein P691DRAFT_854945 [Macrolepiota fuliginosa MF-IS2]|uniref:Uncharacterized protein n=1 Tax=Macrolepiota fuliginosa MF-IS2 TaxID=1400762 RepID=A0A9P5XEA7_9AGAR|nr:hypothetical protein P691DRAFT_854945 [Macrolepiota fuliginosa MF-IS2]